MISRTEHYPPAVAALIAVYRGDSAEKVKIAVDSLLNQEFLGKCQVNIYLGVDGPVDAALMAMVENYADQGRIDLSIFPRNRGVAPVINDLLGKLAEEPYVFRLDADDEALPQRFSTQLDYFASHPEVDVLGTAMWERRFDGTEQIVRFPEHHDEIIRSLYWRVAVANPTVCFRRSVLDATGGYPVQNLSEDLAMWFKCAIHGFRFANIPDPLIYFTVDSNFLARRGLKRAWREYLVWTRGVVGLYGVNWRIVGPVARLFFRLIPKSMRNYAYKSSLRQISSP